MRAMKSWSSILLVVWTVLVAVLAGRNYYEVLGVSKSATDKQIKQAFRKLAMMYHPDRNEDPKAEEKFREIAAAYEILSDPNKRKQYDQFGEAAFQQGGGGGGAGGFEGFHFNFDDFFKNFDNSFHNHRQGKNHQNDGFKFGFGGHDFFNFDDLWNDFEDDEAMAEHDDNDSGFFGFDLGDMFGGFDSMFGGGNSFEEMNHEKIHQKKSGSRSMHVHHSSSGGGGGQKCRTVTQKIGNTVTTFTQCS